MDFIDAPDRKSPRFPADKEQVARGKIKEAVVKEMNSGAGVASGYAGGASGGDTLFLEVCAELGITTNLYLAIPPQQTSDRLNSKISINKSMRPPLMVNSMKRRCEPWLINRRS